MNLLLIILVGSGGAIGALLRYEISGILPVWHDLPVGTLLVNFTGSLMLSVLTFGHNPIPYFLDAGILGGYTTFSTFSYESFRLLEQGENITFFLNILLSLLLCGTGVIIGKWIMI